MFLLVVVDAEHTDPLRPSMIELGLTSQEGVWVTEKQDINVFGHEREYEMFPKLREIGKHFFVICNIRERHRLFDTSCMRRY